MQLLVATGVVILLTTNFCLSHFRRIKCFINHSSLLLPRRRFVACQRRRMRQPPAIQIIMQAPSTQRRAMQRADIPWLATPVAVMLPDTGTATAMDQPTMDQSTMDRSMTAVLAMAAVTVTAMVDARATVALSAG